MAPERGRGRLRRVAAALLKFGLVSVVFVVVVLASGYISMRLALIGRQIIVPDITGMTLAEAQDSLLKQELFFDKTAEKYDDRLEQGRVLAQDPPAGAKIKKYRKVKVVMSLGPRIFKIPDARGQSLGAARIEIQTEGLASGHVAYTYAPNADSDIVISQDPLPSGESLGEGGVSLLVSKGPREAVYVMPDLVGKPSEAVLRALRARGLKIGSVRRDRLYGAEQGTVARQYPESGYPVATGDIISLVVAE